MKLNSKTIISLVVTFFVSAGLAYAVVPSTGGGLVSPKAEIPTEKKTAGFGQFADEPKTEPCPLNGKLFSKSEKTLWEARRPILAMIENDVNARPQSGLASADIVYEAVAEGGITRFMGVFYCGAQADIAKVAPVRSARIYFVNIAAEYNTPIYMHVGGGNCSADSASGQCTSNKKAFALEELVKLGWRKPGGNDFDTIGDIGVPVMKRDYNRLGVGVEIATEHTYVGYLSYAWREAEKRGYNGLMPNGKTWLSGLKPWKTGALNIAGQTAQNIKYDFWSNYKDFTVDWKYDSTTKEYQRSQGSVAHLDLETGKQIAVPNIIVQFAKEEGPLDEHKHMFYTVIGEGTGLYFTGGQAIEIKWKKSKQTERTVFTDKSGKEISFTPGAIWISILPIGNKIVYN
ncbi:MAG: hypothetical protein UW88_C0006G0050 [Candidatus Collierbacteria bacterium GW2011_GWD2_45_10]|uniref:PT repeat-containing protein n=1 Tax=Candidatus Collierbacteria bacterium GW2011_GWB2_44_22 TaxID=1618387 RepID=A0A0G1K7P3_9BACT|nr:MAG: hypothetical protein UW31_C0007G0091 [Candidatus Collierbacteria bacterium GW2011_GWA2_44_13]KKT49157.1 MAG: hypothetical protein UW42_C0039G0006 [Candidatus Collierbacteria bacterium GW2011_GWB1_44_197]KKT52322.1 MAG: hypothetical protein UW44_C0003G0165 [Candidatus Collierbacteria bacterium GW2011_GWB2_44_22]KKT63242.1 MAG: hypothetical protein UW56_C0001G0079 [Candidatus Collierbacteria bacterium GW2011_GWD1_44_27]KKT64514.1 MAG: hypothetical protein UW58_C0041G0004 [Candidatus Colli